ncbi:MAG: hypothetical protein J7L43_02045 [Candidatus Aenigmarchaeota archaeon]|nr:hypothetical protein [Candidatus Aenigmarchaeota archaeon]
MDRIKEEFREWYKEYYQRDINILDDFLEDDSFVIFAAGCKSRDPEIKRLERTLLMYEPWSLIDITKKLLDAADILLHDYDYDGDCWEQIQTAWELGKKAVEE